MKFLLFFLSFFICYDIVFANDLYVSRKDIDTDDYINCDFYLFDSSGNVIDNWVQGYREHIISVSSGSYKLISRPYIMGVFNDDMSSSYMLNVSSDIRFTIYDNIIDTPDNLGYSYNLFGLIFIFIGFLIIYFCKYCLN